MDFEGILSKYIRLPWVVLGGREHPNDAEVAAAVAFDCGAGDFFKQVPEDRAMLRVLHSIAIPVTISLLHGRGDALQQRNRWSSLSAEEKAVLLNTVKLDPVKHKSSLMVFWDDTWRFRMASYIAAAYALTTYTKPYVITFNRLVQITLASLGGDSFEMSQLRQSGLLVVIGAGGDVAGAEKVCGFLSSVLSERTAKGRQHVFIDAPERQLLEVMKTSKKPMVRSSDVESMYKEIYPSSRRMDSLLFGPCVHMYPMDLVVTTTEPSTETSKNECGQAIIV